MTEDRFKKYLHKKYEKLIAITTLFRSYLVRILLRKIKINHPFKRYPSQVFFFNKRFMMSVMNSVRILSNLLKLIKSIFLII